MNCGVRYFIFFIIILAGILSFHLFYVYPELLKVARVRVPYNQKLQLPSWYRNYVELFQNYESNENRYENNSYFPLTEQEIKQGDNVDPNIVKVLNDKYEVTREKMIKNPKLLYKLLDDPKYRNMRSDIKKYLKNY
jgi:hypothetical protein